MARERDRSADAADTAGTTLKPERVQEKTTTTPGGALKPERVQKRPAARDREPGREPAR